jgi:hypothetical protein
MNSVRTLAAVSNSNNQKQMKKIIIAIAAVVTLVSFAPPEWMQFRNIDGRFKVLTRGAMTEKMAFIETDLGSIETHTFVYQPEEQEENLVYMIMYYDFPEGSMHSDSTELIKTFFDTTVEEATASVKGTLIYENAMEHEGYPARQWRINYLENKAVIRSRAFIVKNRFYLLQTIGLTEVEQNNVTDFYLNSFRLLGE